MTQPSLFPPIDHTFKDAARLLEFILSGNAKITVRSEKTFIHHTFKITKPKDSEHWFVKRLSTDSEYHYLGSILRGERYERTRKSVSYAKALEAHTAFDWLLRQLQAGRMPPNATVYHEGRCGMCGRELTDPISIKEGYGPTCREIRLRHSMMYDKEQA